jgi:(2Fe-2S) ferredoxin
MFLEKNQHQYYKYHIFCCTNRRNPSTQECCASKGSEELLSYIKNKVRELKIDSIRVNKAGCLGRCKLGKVMVIYPEGLWYHYDTQEDIDKILEGHFLNNKIVEDLILLNSNEDQVET